jgi:glycosyltransferase involved in cell wall biosynthesis
MVRPVDDVARPPTRRQISIQHRLAGMGGHRFNQALGCWDSALRRGMEPVLFMNAAADAAVRAALPGGQAVLHDPVFRPDLSFDERTALFVRLLHEHVDPVVRRDDRVLMTVATQCEGRALAAWLAELPASRRPWILVLFPADRWNRKGPEERERQVAEFRTFAAELAARGPGAQSRLLFASHTRGLRDELAALLGTRVLLSPMPELDPGPAFDGTAEQAVGRPPRVAVVGGARPEKGHDRLPAIVRASRERTRAVFSLQLFNEQLAAADWAALCRLAAEPGVEAAWGELDRAAYQALFTTADLMLFPYARLPYRQRPSGILSEAILAGLPVVVPSGTWLAEQVEAGAAAGVVYPGDAPEDVAAAIAGCIADLPALASQARERAAAWRRSHSLEPFLDWFERQIAVRQAEEPVARARPRARRLHRLLGMMRGKR